jgi:hypothetical protein
MGYFFYTMINGTKNKAKACCAKRRAVQGGKAKEQKGKSSNLEAELHENFAQ